MARNDHNSPARSPSRSRSHSPAPYHRRRRSYSQTSDRNSRAHSPRRHHHNHGNTTNSSSTTRPSRPRSRSRSRSLSHSPRRRRESHPTPRHHTTGRSSHSHTHTSHRDHHHPSRRNAPLPAQSDSFHRHAHPSSSSYSSAPPAKQLPNWRPTGILAREANTVAGTDIVLKYHEGSDARLATQEWRVFVFRGDEDDDGGNDGGGGSDGNAPPPAPAAAHEVAPPIPLKDRSCWLFGREARVADVPVAHRSVSKQHCVVQFRAVVSGEDGRKRVRPYLIDLDSGNGTRLNGKRIPGRRYVEVRKGDVMRLGTSAREYVFMVEGS